MGDKDTEIYDTYPVTVIFVFILAILGSLSAILGFGFLISTSGRMPPAELAVAAVAAIGGVLMIAAAVILRLVRQIAIKVIQSVP